MGSTAVAILASLFCCIGWTACSQGVELSFEDKYLGFFLKSGHEESRQTNSVLHRDRFLVLQPSRATMVRVGYGPFTAKQTVPYPSSLPLVSFNRSLDLFARWPATTDVAAYLVTREVPRERPVLRVLFHFSQSGRDAGSGSPAQSYQNLCVVLVASHDGRRRTAACSPGSREATCLVELVVPHSWWPPFRTAASGVKTQKTMVSVEYAVAVDVRRVECGEANAHAWQQMTATPLWHVPLSPSPVHYAEVMENGSLQVLVPKATLFPGSKLYVPVFVRKNLEQPVNVFVMSATVKSGLRILDAEAVSDNGWSITLDLNAKRTVASVTAFYQNSDKKDKKQFAEDFEEVFSWLLEVDNGMNLQHSARILWSVRYVQKAGRAVRRNTLDGGINMTTDLEVQKDDIQSVLLVSKTWELVNTAFLNGKQVSLPIKIFIVSQAGKMADVTLQSSCHSADDSILKVSPSCTSVYLDGSEIRGSHNASVVVKYGSYTGHAQFKVWLPKLPLEIYVEDDRLSQVRNWKAPKEISRKLIPRTRDVKSRMEPNRSNSSKRSLRPRSERNKWMCRLRYQQTPVEVFARFIAVDENSGREAYLLNRKTAFRVTELVEDYLRIADPRIAVLKGRTIQGMSIGRTEIQILSPITGLVSGATELRVGKEKEAITGVRLGVVTGLQLSIKPSDEVTNGFVAETTITHQLTAQYQEGLLDIRILFSDGTSTPLSQVAEGDFSLSLQARERQVVALAPMASSHRPRVIALGEGHGAVHVSLETAEECGAGQRPASPLASALVNITVSIRRPVAEKVNLQNDGYHPERKFSGGFRYEPEGPSGPSVQARQNAAHRSSVAVADMSPLEIGMYALLGVFCLAIVVFVASCATYAVQFHKKQVDHYDRKDPVANAHDWVWLGRATLERKAFEGQLAPRRTCNEAVAARKRTRLSSEVLSVTNENAIPFCDPAEPEPPRERRVQIVVNPLDAAASSDSDHGPPPPPVPPHGRPMPSQRASSCGAAPAGQHHEGLPWVSPECPLDYDVLIDYFDNLKESNA